MQPTDTSLYIIIPAVAGAFLVVVISVFIICCVVCRYRQVVNNLKKDQNWINLITKNDALKHKGIFKLLPGSCKAFVLVYAIHISVFVVCVLY